MQKAIFNILYLLILTIKLLPIYEKENLSVDTKRPGTVSTNQLREPIYPNGQKIDRRCWVQLIPFPWNWRENAQGISEPRVTHFRLKDPKFIFPSVCVSLDIRFKKKSYWSLIDQMENLWISKFEYPKYLLNFPCWSMGTEFA